VKGKNVNTLFTYQAKDAQEYQALLFTDPRPWWHQAKPRKKARFKNVKLTNSLRYKQRLTKLPPAPAEYKKAA